MDFPRPPYHQLHHGIYNNEPLAPWTPRRMAFVWPRDGKRDHTKFGRLKDILQNKGPDIFVSNGLNARPTRNTWANRPWLDQDDGIVHSIASPMPWARRQRNQSYNFRTRKYDKEMVVVGPEDYGVIPDPLVWTGCAWTRSPKPRPWYVRDNWGNYAG